MSKLDILNEGRSQGILFAHKIIKTAADEGKDPVEALEEEIKFRKQIKLDTLLTKKEVEKAYEKYHEWYREEAVSTIMGVAGIVLWDVFGFGGQKRLPKFYQECQVYINGLAEGSIKWEDIDEELNKRCGITIKSTEEEA